MSQSKRWCYTLNNYSEDDVAAMTAIDCKYQVFGREVGGWGTPHLQGYIVFNKNMRLAAMKKLNDRCHWEIAKGSTEQNVVYCSKSGDIMETGEKPKTPKEVGAVVRELWTDVIRAAKEGTAEEEYPQQFVQHYATLTKLYQPILENIPEYSGVWYYGDPGSGKSKLARENYPGAYEKLPNKWWDGYVDEDAVIIDDLSLDHKHMGSFLKRYADHYPYRAEFKGGSKLVRPKTIIVTSNYTIDEIFGGDDMLVAALHRRFKCTRFTNIKHTK